LDEFCNQLGDQIVVVSEEISKAIQTQVNAHARPGAMHGVITFCLQAKAGKQASQDIAEARAAIEDLCGKIGDIKKKATQSEQMV
jgi:hypothetical protein